MNGYSIHQQPSGQRQNTDVPTTPHFSKPYLEQGTKTMPNITEPKWSRKINKRNINRGGYRRVLHASLHLVIHLKEGRFVSRSPIPGKSTGVPIHDSSTKSWEASNILLSKVSPFIPAANSRWRRNGGHTKTSFYNGTKMSYIVNSPPT